MSESALIRAVLPLWTRQFDRPPYAIGVERGIVWATVPGPLGPHCGYAIIPAEGHPWSAGFPGGADSIAAGERSRAVLRRVGAAAQAGVPIEQAMMEAREWENPYCLEDLDAVIDVHGGLTYYHHPILGFDTLHLGDVWPPEFDPQGISDASRRFLARRMWTPELVIEEAKRLARQVAALGDK